MGRKQMEFLKRNAEYFEKKAVEAVDEEPKFVLFFTEQALQLYLKYILAKKFGDYPKTHKLRILLRELAKLSNKVTSFIEKNELILDLLEEAYITTRYIDKDYSKDSAKEAIRVLKEFKAVFKEWL